MLGDSSSILAAFFGYSSWGIWALGTSRQDAASSSAGNWPPELWQPSTKRAQKDPGGRFTAHRGL